MPERGERTRPLRRLWVIAGAGVASIICLLSFLVATFPYRDMLAAMLAPHRLKITYTGQRASIPIGVTLTDVRLLSTASHPNQLLMQGDRLTLRPTLGSLLLGGRSVHVSAALYGGEVRALIEQRPDSVALQFALDALDLARSQPLRQFDVELGGKLSCDGTAAVGGSSIDEDSADSSFTGHDVILRVAPGFPPISLGRVDGRATLDHGTLNFEHVQSSGGDFTLRADGALALADELKSSELHARVYLTPTPSGRAHFGFFLRFLPHPPSAGPYYIDGPLYAPSIH
jgi:type II secretion system protein N